DKRPEQYVFARWIPDDWTAFQILLPRESTRTSQAGRAFVGRAQVSQRRSDLLDARKAGPSPPRKRGGADPRIRTNQRRELLRYCLLCRKPATSEWTSGIKPEERLQTLIPHRSKPSTNARAYLLAPRRTSEQMIGSAAGLSALTSTGRKTKMRQLCLQPGGSFACLIPSLPTL